MMNVLITGYSGFIGSILVDELISIYNLKLLGRRVPSIHCDFLKATIDPVSDYTSILNGVDVVIHLAARVHVIKENVSDELDAYREVNVRGTLNLAEQAARAGVKRFIFLSSIKLHGEKTLSDSLFTNLDKHKPVDPFGVSKSEAEQQLLSLFEQFKTEYVFIRPPLVYGKGVKANFSSLQKLVGRNLPLPFGLLTENKRSLVSVYNLVDLIKVCINHPNAANQIFLVSDDNDLSTTSIVKLMAIVQGVKPILLPIPVCFMRLLGTLTGKCVTISRLTDSLRVDITHTKETLNWTPPYSVEQGFAKCLENKDV